MSIASILQQPAFLFAGFLARFEHVRVPASVRTDDPGGAYCGSCAVWEGSDPQSVGDIVLTTLPVVCLLFVAKQWRGIRLAEAGTSSGKPFSGFGGIS